VVDFLAKLTPEQRERAEAARRSRASRYLCTVTARDRAGNVYAKLAHLGPELDVVCFGGFCQYRPRESDGSARPLHRRGRPQPSGRPGRDDRRRGRAPGAPPRRSASRGARPFPYRAIVVLSRRLRPRDARRAHPVRPDGDLSDVPVPGLRSVAREEAPEDSAISPLGPLGAGSAAATWRCAVAVGVARDVRHGDLAAQGMRKENAAVRAALHGHTGTVIPNRSPACACPP
jgi:hypothetical protein